MERSKTEISAFQRLRNACIYRIEEARRMIGTEPALLNVRNCVGETVMHWLAVENQIAAVTALLDLGAEVDPVNDFESTPLLECVTLENAELVELFIVRGKPWKYALIPHDVITDNMTIQGLGERWCA